MSKASYRLSVIQTYPPYRNVQTNFGRGIITCVDVKDSVFASWLLILSTHLWLYHPTIVYWSIKWKSLKGMARSWSLVGRSHKSFCFVTHAVLTRWTETYKAYPGCPTFDTQVRERGAWQNCIKEVACQCRRFDIISGNTLEVFSLSLLYPIYDILAA